jgi:hypothetical protein
MRKINRRGVRRHPQFFHMALCATLLIVLQACSAFGGVAGGSPQPTHAPTGSSSSAPTTLPTGTPTQRAVIDHPTGATDVILRVEWGGGFVAPQANVTQAPAFTLYGDGTVIFRPTRDAGMTVSDAFRPFLTGRMSEGAIQDLLDYALHEGGLQDAQTSYDYPGIADAGTVTFWINAGGADKTVAVYALMEGTIDGPEAVDRKKLLELYDRLSDFAPEARAGAVDRVTDFEPDAYNVVMFDTMGDPSNTSTIFEWPWRDIEPADFVQPDEYPSRVLRMSADDVAKLTDVPNGGQVSIWVKAPDGSNVTFALRPMLPDEVFSDEPSVRPTD